MTARLKALVLITLALAACELGKKTTVTAAGAQCLPVAAACGGNADCCSYGCIAGICEANASEGGACRTSDDCIWGMECKSGACSSLATCRDDLDVCSSDNYCCSGNCAGATYLTDGHCQPNHPPTVDLGASRDIPYHQPYTLAAAVSDPDGDTLVYGWTLVAKPPGSAAALSSATAASPSFTPDLAGPYVVKLAVTDGYAPQPQRLTAQQTITLTAVNTPPTAAAGAPAPAASRNVVLPLSGAVADPDGDALTCTWTVTAPDATQTVVAGPASCASTFGGSFTPTVEGAWTATLTVEDHTAAAPAVAVHTVTASRSVTCVNDPPVASAGPDRVGNAAALGQASAPAIPLQGTATDVNGDVGTVGFTWTWTLDAKPATSALAVGSVLGATAALSFVPDAVGLYTLRLHADDGHGGTSEDTAVVDVQRPFRPLGAIAAAAHLGATTDKLVLAGVDPSGATAYRLWILDPTSPAAPVEVPLDASPTALAVSPDGTTAIVGEAGAKWQKVTGLDTATPAKSGLYGAPYTPEGIAYADATHVLAAGYISSNTASALYELVEGAPGYAAVSCSQGCFYATPVPGTRIAAGGGALFAVDAVGNTLTRYTLRANGSVWQTNQVTSLFLPDDLWVSGDGSYVFLSSAYAYVAATLSSQGYLPASPNFLDSRGYATGFRGLVTGPSSLTAFGDAPFPGTGTDMLPKLGVSGVGYSTYGRFAFVALDGTTHYAIVSADPGTGSRYGLVTFP